MQKQKESLAILMAKAIMVVAIIASFGAVLGVAGYLAKNKQTINQEPEVSVAPKSETANQIIDETADWKTYRNEEYGFEVKYPKSLILSQNNNYNGSNNQMLDKVLLKLNENSDNFITINRFEIGEGQTFEDVIAENSWLPGGGTRHEDFSKFKLVEIGDNSYYYRYFCGDPFGSVEDGNEACGFFYYYWLVNNQSVFGFELSDVLATGIEKSNPENYENPPSHLELKQILSTFKFIEK